MKSKIVVNGYMSDEVLAPLKEVFDVKFWTDAENVPDHVLEEWLYDAVGLCNFNPCLSINSDLLKRTPNLKVLIQAFPTYHNVRTRELSSLPIRFVPMSTPASNESIAEFITILMGIVSRRIMENRIVQLTDTKISSSTMSKGKDLSRSTLGIIGMDDIGISISRRARAFGMTVVYHNESPRNDDKLFMTTYRELDDLLAHSDVVIVMNSGRNSKKVMCNTSFFNAMKDDAIFISATTTEQIDLDALRKTLHEGKLNYAALAVDNEFDSNALLETDKCLVVPMSAAFTERSIKEIDSVTVTRMIKELQNSL